MYIHEDVAVSFVASTSVKTNQVRKMFDDGGGGVVGLPDRGDIGVRHCGVVIPKPASSIKPTTVLRLE